MWRWSWSRVECDFILQDVTINSEENPLVVDLGRSGHVGLTRIIYWSMVPRAGTLPHCFPVDCVSLVDALPYDQPLA